MIPQVINVANAIKIAGDFVSVENLAVTQRLVPALREQRLRDRTSDILQLQTTIWLAWLSVTTYSKPLDYEDDGDPHQSKSSGLCLLIYFLMPNPHQAFTLP